jgi:hypothetical protein
MFESIGNFCSSLWNTGIDELNSLRDCLISVLIATAIGIILMLVFRPSIKVCLWIALLPCLFTAYRLFSIRKFIIVHITGEILERLNIHVVALEQPAVPTSIFNNPFIKKYWEVVSGIFLAQILLFLLLPLYVNYTAGDITAAVAIIMLLVMIAISCFEIFLALFRGAVVLTIILYSIGLFFLLFPQVSPYMKDLLSASNVNVMLERESIMPFDGKSSKSNNRGGEIVETPDKKTETPIVRPVRLA